MAEIPNTNEIALYFHCSLCVRQYEEESPQMSRAEFARLDIGWTKLGFQVWCRRHDINVMHVDFQGCKHPANLATFNPDSAHEEEISAPSIN